MRRYRMLRTDEKWARKSCAKKIEKGIARNFKVRIIFACAMVGVVQLVERQIVVLDVVGSSPITHPMRCISSKLLSCK